MIRDGVCCNLPGRRGGARRRDGPARIWHVSCTGPLHARALFQVVPCDTRISVRMQFLDLDECQEWSVAHGYGLRRDLPLPEERGVVRVTIRMPKEDPPSRAVAAALQRALGTWDEKLVWVAQTWVYRHREERYDIDRALELAAADRLLGAADVTGPFAVIHPGATDPRRRWPPAHFARVARALQNQGVPVVVVGSEGDIVAEVGERAAAQPLLDLVFGELVGLLARASILVGNDSGPRHLADALGTPTVAVYWCGNMVNAAPVARRNHRAHISWTTACPICGCSLVGEPFPLRCSDNVSLVSEVPVDAVVSSTLALLEADGVLTARAWTEVGP